MGMKERSVVVRIDSLELLRRILDRREASGSHCGHGSSQEIE